jgi:hypothetical protein
MLILWNGCISLRQLFHSIFIVLSFMKYSSNTSHRKIETYVWTSAFPMERRAVIRFLTLKGVGVQRIHSKLESVYHKEALTLPTVDKCSARLRVMRTNLSNEPRSGTPRKSDLATVISAMLEGRPLLSCKLIARLFSVANTPCLRILREDLGLKKFHLQWVPHTIDLTRSGIVSHFLASFWQSCSRSQKRISWISWLATSLGSFDTIHMTPLGLALEMNFPCRSSQRLTMKSA